MVARTVVVVARAVDAGGAGGMVLGTHALPARPVVGCAPLVTRVWLRSSVRATASAAGRPRHEGFCKAPRPARPRRRDAWPLLIAVNRRRRWHGCVRNNGLQRLSQHVRARTWSRSHHNYRFWLSNAG